MQEMEGGEGHIDPLLYTLPSSQPAGGSLTATTITSNLATGVAIIEQCSHVPMQYGNGTIPGQSSVEYLLLTISQHNKI